MTAAHSPEMEQWIAALRSDEYMQADGTLLDRVYLGEEHEDAGGESFGESYCCLGVACKIADPGDDWGWTGLDLPEYNLANWLGLGAVDGEDFDPLIDTPLDFVDPQGSRMVLTCSTLNDSLHLTFPQIADMLDYFGLKEVA